MYATIPEFFSHTVKQFPDRVALRNARQQIGEPKEITYSELAHLTEALASGLAGIGIEKGDKVAIMSRPRIGFAAAFLALARLGAWALPLDPTFTASETGFILGQAEAKAVFAPGRLRERLPQDGPTIIDLDDGADGTPLSELITESRTEAADVRPSDVAVLAYTSGTTGGSKGVMLSHANLTADIEACLAAMPIDENDTFLTIAPWHHILGLTTAFLLPIYTGALTIYTDDYRSIAQQLLENSVTIFTGVPKLYHAMFEKLIYQIKGTLTGRIGHALAPRLVGKKVRKKLTGGSLRFFVSGSAPLDPQVSMGFRRLGIGMLEGYGLTETSPVVSFCAPFSPKAGSVGRPLPTVEVKLTDTAPDGVGELLVRGPTLMQGYYKNDEATRRVLDGEGWFHTGDLALIDDDEEIFLKGRVKNVIVLPNGKNVYPEELEWEIARIPYVEEVLVKGATKNGQETVVAVIYPNEERLNDDGLAEDPVGAMWKEIKERQRRLAPHKRLRGKDRVTIADKPFPKTSTMDIKRHLYKGGNDVSDH